MSSSTVHRARRVLAIAGDVLVKVGDQVSAGGTGGKGWANRMAFRAYSS